MGGSFEAFCMDYIYSIRCAPFIRAGFPNNRSQDHDGSPNRWGIIKVVVVLIAQAENLVTHSLPLGLSS